MRVILDTNVLISGIFFGGFPGRIVTAWRDAAVRIVTSPEILSEYADSGDSHLLAQSGYNNTAVLRPAEIVKQHPHLF